MVNPIKQWYATNNDGYKFAYGPDGYNPGDGWTQGGIVFWTYILICSGISPTKTLSLIRLLPLQLYTKLLVHGH